MLAHANVWAEAIVSNDAGRIAAFVTTDWVIVSDTGISPGEKFLALVASGDLTHSAMDIVGRARIRVMGETAILTSRITSTTNYLGHQCHADEWTTDVFVKRGSRWPPRTSRATSSGLEWCRTGRTRGV